MVGYTASAEKFWSKVIPTKKRNEFRNFFLIIQGNPILITLSVCSC